MVGVSPAWKGNLRGQVTHQEEPTEHDPGNANEVDEDVFLREVRSRDVW